MSCLRDLNIKEKGKVLLLYLNTTDVHLLLLATGSVIHNQKNESESEMRKTVGTGVANALLNSSGVDGEGLPCGEHQVHEAGDQRAAAASFLLIGAEWFLLQAWVNS